MAGRYRLDKRLGRGGMGEVWRAHDLELGRSVAVKVLLESHEAGELLARFRREAAIGAQFQHPGITMVHDVGRHGNRLFIVMELLDGEDLADLLARRPLGGLAVKEAASLIAQAADALAETHARGVVHRDLKPANLFRLADGRLKICDFGIARVVQATEAVTRTGSIIGTPPYMAPEQWRGEDVDTPADMYALGCVLYELLAGAPPFPMTNEASAMMYRHLEERAAGLRSLRADIPAELSELVAELLAKDPSARPNASTAARRLHEIAHRAPDPHVSDSHVPDPDAALASLTPQPPNRAVVSTVLPHSPAPMEDADAAASTRNPVEDASGGLRGPRRRGFILGGAAAVVAATGATAIALRPTRAGGAPSAQRSTEPGSATPTPRPTKADGISSVPQSTTVVSTPPHLWFTLTGHASIVESMAFSPGGRTLASCGDDETVRLWDMATRTSTATLTGHSEVVESVAISPDEKTLASGSDDKSIRLWDIASRVCTATLAGHSGAVASVAFSPDGGTLASSSEDKTIRLWNVATRGTIATLTGHAGAVSSAKFSPDGKTLASGGEDKTVRLWDVAAHAGIATLTGHFGGVYSVAFSPDGKILASSSDDETVRLWEVATHSAIATLTGSVGSVYSVAFSPDGKTLASCGADKTIRLWDVASQAAVATLTGHAGAVDSVAFSPDGKALASGSDDKTVRIWELG